MPDEAKTPTMLFDEATVRTNSGDIVGAACYARESVRRSLVCLCAEHGCLPLEKTPTALANSLERNGVISRSRRHSLLHLVRILDKAARLQQFRAKRIMRAIAAARLAGHARVELIGGEV